MLFLLCWNQRNGYLWQMIRGVKYPIWNTTFLAGITLNLAWVVSHYSNFKPPLFTSNSSSDLRTSTLQNISKHLLIYVETKTQEKHPNVPEIKEIGYENCCLVYNLTLLLSCIFYIISWQAGSSDSLHEIRTLQVQSRSICLADREGSFRSLSHFPGTAGNCIKHISWKYPQQLNSIQLCSTRFIKPWLSHNKIKSARGKEKPQKLIYAANLCYKTQPRSIDHVPGPGTDTDFVGFHRIKYSNQKCLVSRKPCTYGQDISICMCCLLFRVIEKMKIPSSLFHPSFSDLSAPENNPVAVWHTMNLKMLLHVSMSDTLSHPCNLPRRKTHTFAESRTVTRLILRWRWWEWVEQLETKHHLNIKNLLRVLQGRADGLAGKHCSPENALLSSKSISCTSLVQKMPLYKTHIQFCLYKSLSWAVFFYFLVKVKKKKPNRICEITKGKRSSGSTVLPTIKLNYVPSSKDSFEGGM